MPRRPETHPSTPMTALLFHVCSRILPLKRITTNDDDTVSPALRSYRSHKLSHQRSIYLASSMELSCHMSSVQSLQNPHGSLLWSLSTVGYQTLCALSDSQIVLVLKLLTNMLTFTLPGTWRELARHYWISYLATIACLTQRTLGHEAIKRRFEDRNGCVQMAFDCSKVI